MKKIIFVLVVFVLIIVGGYLIFKKVGDIRPSLFPASQNAATIIKKNNEASKLKGEPLNIPLKLSTGFAISVFADNLNGPRDLVVSPDGTLLVSVPSEGMVLALIDSNQDGTVDESKVVLNDLSKPHGLAFFAEYLFVASETEFGRYRWDEETKTAALDKKLFDMPKGGRHTTRSIAFLPSGEMFVSIGSSCDTCVEDHPWLATVIKSDSEGRDPTVFAQGLRNAVFIKTHPETDQLWGVEMGRDFLGDNKPPDEINIIEKDKHYGWPFCYGDQVYDPSLGQRDQAFCDTTIAPVYKIQAHSAPLGLTFIDSPIFPESWQGDLLVSYHGSWNRSTPVGYKVVHMNVEGGRVTSEEDFLSGFLQGSTALGRPVDMEFGSSGELYLSDDKSGAVYLITSD